MKRSFERSSIVITGAGSGLGRALAVRFGRCGAAIIGIDLDAAGLADTAKLLGAEQIRFQSFVCDISDRSSCAEVRNEIVSAGYKIDCLINNAGISHRSPFVSTDVAVIEKMINVNFLGAVYWTDLLLDELIERKGMVIVISSVSGYTPLIGRTGYAASKHALHGFFESLRTEIRDAGTSVMMVCPSFVDTNIDNNALGGDGRRTGRKRVTLGRVLSPEIVADAIYAAAVRNRRMIIIGPTGRLAWWVSRFFPAFYEQGMAKRLRKEID